MARPVKNRQDVVDEIREQHRLWVCEKGHVDDHHLVDPNPQQLCSRCGGRCTEFASVDLLARAFVRQSPLSADDGERLGNIAAKLERATRDLDPDGRDIRYLRALAKTALNPEARAAEPPYPADLLDALAKGLAAATMGVLPSVAGTHPFRLTERDMVREALDRYEQEVGRENVPREVALAIGELGG